MSLRENGGLHELVGDVGRSVRDGEVGDVL